MELFGKQAPLRPCFLPAKFNFPKRPFRAGKMV
jgi:hypothetical protein